MTDDQGRDAARWTQIRTILADALELPAAERPEFLARSCDDPEVREEIQRYLDADAAGSGLLHGDLADFVVDAEAESVSGYEPPVAAAPVSEPETGSVGRYELLEMLGEGGMGSVYRAMQTEPVQREVALKIIKPGMANDAVVARFESERQALAVMDHPNIAKVLDAGATDTGRPYFVMELVRGVPLDEYCDTHKLGTDERIDLFVQVCDAVQHAHQKGVIHRDLKPSNILVAFQGAAPVPKVIDFGIAKAVGSSLTDSPHVTRIGQILGTPAYMSPEQAERSGLDVDTRTDVYSLGVILYELLAGSLPFDREAFRQPDYMLQWLLREKDVPTPSARLSSLADTQETVARNRTTDVRTLRRVLRGDLDWIVMKAMEKDRTRRYDTASELAEELRRFRRGEPVSARPPSAAYRFAKFARRHRAGLAAGVALFLSLAAGVTVSTIGFTRADRNAALAEEAAGRAGAVSDFLDQMLRAADPVSGGGPSMTVQEVLDVASEEVAGGALRDQPLVEIDVRRSIGGTYMHLGLLEKAAEHFGAVLALLATIPAADDLVRVTVLDELGQLTRRQGDGAAAERYYRHALALADSAGLSTDGGAGESMVNRVRNDLGLALRGMDRIDEAAEVLEELAASERRLLASDDVDLATTLNNLALVRRAQGDIDGAISLFWETLGILKAAFGEQHLYVAAVLESIGSLEQRLGRYGVADSLMTEALVMRREILGEEHPDIVNGLNGLGLLHVEMGELDEAREYLDEALEMSLAVHGQRHTQTASVLNSVGLLHLRRQDAAAAEESFRTSVEVREDVLGERHRNTLNTKSNLAAALVLGGRASEAERIAREVVDLEAELGLADAVMVGSALRTLGRALAALERWDEAESNLVKAHTLQNTELGPSHAQTQSTLRALVELYEGWGRADQAQVWRGRLVGS